MFVIDAGDSSNKNDCWLTLKGECDSFSEKEYILGTSNYPGNVVYEIMHGEKINDVMGTSGLSYIFSDRVISALINHNCTGFEYHPIIIESKNGLIKNYFVVRTLDVCSAIDKTVAKLVPSNLNPEYMTKIGFGIDESSIKSDITMPLGTSYMLCNSKVKDMISNLSPKCEGIKFVPITEVQVF